MTHAATISIRRLVLPRSVLGRLLAVLAPVLDRLLGLARIDEIYRNGSLRGLSPFDFAQRGLDVLGIGDHAAGPSLGERVPVSGPVLVVCNHPFGAVEALVIAKALGPVRRDVKILANAALQVFPELAPLLILTNPLRVTQANLSSIRQCQRHLARGGVLVTFPAGRVSFRKRWRGRIADGDWNRFVGHLALGSGASIIPVFFAGANRAVFHALGRLWDRAKLLLLTREMLALRGHVVRYSAGRALPESCWRHLDAARLTRFVRVMVYAQDRPTATRRTGQPRQAAPLAPDGDSAVMAGEIAALPGDQRLLDFKHFAVFFASESQMPTVMAQIARERERVFRALDEGSGDARDGDRFDETYVQLVAWDNRARALVGAYRLGRTDLLRAARGNGGLYLSQMFRFDDAFYESAPPSLELGRSFVVPEHQKSFHALYLLWQGIGRYLCLHPQYRRLYGTVSLSRLYDDQAIAILCDALIEPNRTVRPRHELAVCPHPDWRDWRREAGRIDLATLSGIVRGLDAEGKDLPVLLKHYHKLGARFHCVGVDPNFSDTPGLLLSVDIPSLGKNALATFLGAGADDYLLGRRPEDWAGAATAADRQTAAARA